VTEIILDQYDDLDRIANRIADVGTSSDATTRVEVALQGLIPDHLRDFFLFCIKNAHRAVDVDSAVIRLRRSRKTLSNWLAVAHLPPPARILGWTRVLIAARMLEDTTRSTEKVARELHFMSGTALRNMIRRYLGCGPEMLRQRGGFEYALRLFVEELESRKHVHR
jgi:transcriptional regulator GlxA family with amidase domain